MIQDNMKYPVTDILYNSKQGGMAALSFPTCGESYLLALRSAASLTTSSATFFGQGR